MDDIVKQAMAKWPNVPHCYGWLALDARGGWRMRDERAQALHLPGERIGNAALLAFINRNYTHDAQGRWYFQNGPQRVYVSLDATPYIARTDPVHGFLLHTGEMFDDIGNVYMTESGQLVLTRAERVAQLDDRDLAQCLARLRMNDAPPTDAQLLDWLSAEEASAELEFEDGNRRLPVQRIATDSLAAHFGFAKTPQAEE